MIFNSNVFNFRTNNYGQEIQQRNSQTSFAALQSGTGLNANELKQFLLKYNINRTKTTTDNNIIFNETTGKTLKNL